jgi:hypothetical protein
MPSHAAACDISGFGNAGEIMNQVQRHIHINIGSFLSNTDIHLFLLATFAIVLTCGYSKPQADLQIVQRILSANSDLMHL